MKAKTLKVGDAVTCKIAVEAYYSGCGNNPIVFFKPGMIGVIKSITPKVCIIQGPDKDAKPDFYVVDFVHNGKTHRCSLNFCNAVRK